jgi:hypothetical protein
MLELDGIPEMRLVVYMITGPGSMTRSSGGGIVWIRWRNPLEDGAHTRMHMITQLDLLILME